MNIQSRPRLSRLLLLMAPLTLSACFFDSNTDSKRLSDGSDGPTTSVTPAAHELGDATAGRDVFRFATFGNERFFTDAMQLQQGIVANNVTPRQALAIGLSVDADAVPPTTKQQLADELAQDPTGATPLPGNSTTVLDDPANTVALVNANAVIGVTPKDSNGDGTIDIANGDKSGATCALCHTETDRSVFNVANGGGIGSRLDGRASHNLDFGSLIALANNTRSYYPVLQLALTANGGATIGRDPGVAGLTENSSEGEVDAYLKNKTAYPVGMFDDTFDGNGDPMHNMPLFRQDLAFPFGSEGTLSKQDNFANLVYTGLLDPTNLTQPGGRAFLHKVGGKNSDPTPNAGDEIADDYVIVLDQTGVVGYPFTDVTAATPEQAGTEEFPLGVRVDDAMLKDLNAFLFALPAPPGVKTDTAAIARGRDLFRSTAVGCTGCHNVNQDVFVPAFVVAMATIFPGDNPVLLAERDPPLNPILNTVENIFDDKMAVINASIRGDIRGIALPLLLDLARKPVFLHDNSVPNLETLLDPVRGASAPHPFFLTDASQRADVITFLKSLDTTGN